MSSKWLSLEEALAKALDAAYAIDDVEQVSIFEANNRILAHDLVATLDVPPWDNSAMDGYAVNVEDLSGSNELEVQGIITAGMEADTPLQKGKAFKIMTGAPIPNNANAVVMVENTSECNGNVEINKRPIAHENPAEPPIDARGDDRRSLEGMLTERVSPRTVVIGAAAGPRRAACPCPLRRGCA